MDHQGLLTGRDFFAASPADTVDEDELMAELADAAGGAAITELRHVRKSVEKRAA
jgi:hypothetical protein